jgi:methyltransferase (TIGR00027 family)
MRPGRRSSTSTWVSAVRALYTNGPARLAVLDDAPAFELLPLRLSALLRVAGAVPFGVQGLHRALGAATNGVTYDIALRTASIDDVVRDAVADQVTQVVVLGAGLDTRAWRMPELEHAAVFELDYPSTQAYKRPRIEPLPPLAREVHFLPIDFERQGPDKVLEGTSFRRDQRSLWICEGVSQFLTHAAVDAVLDGVARASAPGSSLLLTYLPPGYAGAPGKRLAELVTRLVREPLKTTLAQDEVQGKLGRRGFAVLRDESAPEWAARYWPERQARRVRAVERLVVAALV